MGFSSFQDIGVWRDMREATISTGQTLTFFFETSPSKDNNLFTPMHTPSTGIALVPSFTAGLQLDSGGLPRVILATRTTRPVPLATWVRWRFSPSSGITTPCARRVRIIPSTVRTGKRVASSRP